MGLRRTGLACLLAVSTRVDLSSPPKSLFFRWKLRRAQGPTTQAVRQAAERTSPHARNRGLHHHRPRRTVQSLPSDPVYAHWQNRTRLRHRCSRRRFSQARSKRRVVLHGMHRRPPRADCAASNPSSNPLRRRTSSSCGTRESTPAPSSLSCSPLPALPSTGPCRGLARRSQCGRLAEREQPGTRSAPLLRGPPVGRFVLEPSPLDLTSLSVGPSTWCAKVVRDVSLRPRSLSIRPRMSSRIYSAGRV